MLAAEDAVSNTPPSYRDGVAMVRLLHLLERTRGRAMALDDLADRLEVHRRTVKRYIDALGEGATTSDGEPLVRMEGRGVAARVVLPARREPTSARLFQYAAVFAATRTLTAGEGSVLGDSADQLVSELEQGFEARLLPLVRRAQEAFVYVPFGPKDYRAGEDALDAVVQGCVYRRPLQLRYRTRTGWDYGCRFDPFTVVLYRDALFVHGRQHDVGDASGLRLLAVDRILEADVLKGGAFDVPEDYDAEAWFDGHLGLWQDGSEPERVRIAFSARAALTARERLWPGDASWSDDEDGRSVLQMTVPVTPEVRTWVLTWGAEAEVLEPAGLREEVRDVLERALLRYAGGGGAT